MTTATIRVPRLPVNADLRSKIGRSIAIDLGFMRPDLADRLTDVAKDHANERTRQIAGDRNRAYTVIDDLISAHLTGDDREIKKAISRAITFTLAAEGINEEGEKR